MAAPPTHSADDDGAVGSRTMFVPSRPIVPAVPRRFEKQHPKRTARTPSVASETSQTVSASLNTSPPSPTHHEQAGAEVDYNKDEWASMVEEEVGEATEPGIDISHSQEDGGSQISNASLAGNTGHEELNMQPDSNLHETLHGVHHFTNSIPPLTMCQPSTFYPRALESTIVFGGDTDSASSSPTLPPSAASTVYTQPTPISDSTSSRSHSLYQGYGHANPLFGPYPPPKKSSTPPTGAQEQPHFMQSPGSEVPVTLLLAEPTVTVSEPHGLVLGHKIPAFGSLTSYLLSQFNDPFCADCQLDLVIGGITTTLMVHGVLLAQSPILRAQLVSAVNSASSNRRLLHILVSEPFITAASLISALRCTYGKSAPESFSSLLSSTQNFDQERSPVFVETALSFFAAGQKLLLSGVTVVGLQAALQALSFSSLENVLSVALYYVSDSLENTNSAESLPQENFFIHQAKNLLFAAVNFLVINFPSDFTFDAHAVAVDSLGGFDAHQSRDAPANVNPILKSIQFGQFSRPSRDSTLISSILVSVPFSLLEMIFDRLGQPHHLLSVIEEREKRRLNFLWNTAGGSQIQSSQDEMLLTKAKWEERVHGDLAHPRLTRVPVDPSAETERLR